jgi:hypothetical protein
MTTQLNYYKHLICILLVLLISSSGCKTLSLPNISLSNPKTWFDSKVKESPYGTPTHMVVIWTDDVYTQTGKPQTRGFGARIYFYDEKEKAIPVEGQLVVYGYDDTQKQNSSSREPDRKFAFTPEQFTKHFSSTDLGASYSIWIPWDNAVNDHREVSLLPVFTTTSGKVVMGQTAVNVLGSLQRDSTISKRNKTEIRRQTEPSSSVSPVAHYEATESTHSESSESASTPATNAKAQMRTSTIELPDSMSRRMRASIAPPVMNEVKFQTPLPINPQMLLQPTRPTNDSLQTGGNGTAYDAGVISRPTAAGDLPPQSSSAQPEDRLRSLPKFPAPAWPAVGANPVRAPIPPRPQ